jgi:ATP-dependent DNA ligase
MIKVKRSRTADCVVAGFRYETNSREAGSLLLGLCDEGGKLDNVGFTSTIMDVERASLTRKSKGYAGRQALPVRRRPVRAGGALTEVANGSRCGQNLLSKFGSTMSAAIDKLS